MYRKETRGRLCELLVFLGESEDELEQFRTELCRISAFEPFSAFKRLDSQRNGCIHASDLQVFLAQNNVYFDEIDCQTFVHQYDIDQDQRLSFIEFVKSVLPFEDEDLRGEVTQRPHYDQQESLAYDIETALAKLIEKEITINKKAEIMKVLLHKCSGFKANDAFSRIDRHSEGEINLVNLQEYLLESGCAIQELERTVALIIQRLDRSGESALSLVDFLLGIQPLQIAFDKQIQHEADRSFIDRNILNSSYHSINNGNKSALNESGYSTQNYSSQVLNNLNESILQQQQQLQQQQSHFSQTVNQLMNSSLLSETNKQQRSHQNSNYHSGQHSYQSYQRVTDASFRNYISDQKLVTATFGHPNSSTAAVVVNRTKRSFSNIDEDSIGRPRLIVKQDKFFRRRGIEKYKDSRIYLEVKAVVGVLRQMIEFEKEIELIKQDLAMCADFNFQDAFRVFDPLDQGLVTQAEFQETLSSLGIYYGFEDVVLFFRKYDKDADGRIRFSDFVDAVMPKQKEYSAMINHRHPRSKRNPIEFHRLFAKDTRNVFKQLLDKQLESLYVIESMVHALIKEEGSASVDLASVFDVIDSDGDGQISSSDIKRQIELQGFSTTEKDLVYLMERFNAFQHESTSSSKIARISYGAFLNELSPQLQTHQQQQQQQE